MKFFTEIIGYLAAVFGTALMMPQLYKSFKTKRVDDISMVMLVVYLINCSLWETYGILIKSNPVIICNFLALIIGSIQVYAKKKFQTR
jgi:MtN3 and saliva related transmembrane protein